MRLFLAISLASVFILNACAKQIEYRPIALERPARPVLPTLSIEQGNQINQATWDILTTRHRMMRQYSEQLEVIIDATKKEDK